MLSKRYSNLKKAMPTSPGREWGELIYYDEMVVAYKEYLTEKIALRELESLLSRTHTVLNRSDEGDSTEQCPVSNSIKLAHSEILKDPEFLELLQRYTQKTLSISKALHQILLHWRLKFDVNGSSKNKDRFTDIHDVINRLFSALREGKRSVWPERVIIYTRGGLPSSIIDVPSEKIRGVISGCGTYDCHVSILARAKGIPCLNQLDLDSDQLVEGTEVLIDGRKGHFLQQPDNAAKATCVRKKDRRVNCTLPSCLQDGTKIEVLANIKEPSQIESATTAGASGIGLVRTEYLALEAGEIPDFATQLQFYRELFKRAQGSQVVRLFDLGNDKVPSSGVLQSSKNPALALRGVRFLLSNKKILKEQLAAIITAWKEVEGENRDFTLKVLVPMVTCYQEMKEVRKLFDALLEENKIKRRPLIGAMIEVPSAAISIDALAKESDFFSLGSNDLLQYTCALDRNLFGMQKFYNPKDPAFLRLVSHCVRECKRLNKQISLCGEIAANRKVLPLLIGMGLRSFSLCPTLIVTFKKGLKRLRLEALEEKVAQLIGPEPL